MRASDSDYVYYLETRGRGIFLRASPIDVSRIVRDALFDRMRATILTSATLAVDGSFEYVKGRLGIGERGRSACGVGVRLRAPGAALPSAPHAAAKGAVVRRGGRARDDRAAQTIARARVRAVHQLRRAAHRAALRGDGAAVPDPRAGDRAALDAHRAVPIDAECRPAGHVELLAGRGCGGRRPELRDHRQAARSPRLQTRSRRRASSRSTPVAEMRLRITRCRSPSWLCSRGSAG